jgi:dihydrofolate reductase
VRRVTYSLGLSLDGYAMGPDGGFDWAAPDPAVFGYARDEVRGVDVHLMGRRLYETMRYWEPGGTDVGFDADEQAFAELWRVLPKVVFSRTLTEVEGAGRLATGSLAEEIDQLRHGGDGDIAIGGPDLARQAADLGLLDEYRLRIHPVLVGGGTPFFAHHQQQVDLELVHSRTFDSGVVALRYRTRR